MGQYLTNGTQMLALNIYNTAISKNSYALGQAKAVFFFIILACVSLIQVCISNKKEIEMLMKKKKVITVVLAIVGILVAMYTLFPFYLVVMNAFKNAKVLLQIQWHLKE